LVAAAKFLVTATKNLFVVPNFVALTKPVLFVFEMGFTVEGRRKVHALRGEYFLGRNSLIGNKLWKDLIDGIAYMKSILRIVHKLFYEFVLERDTAFVFDIKRSSHRDFKREILWYSRRVG